MNPLLYPLAFIAMLGLMILEMTAIVWFPILCVWCGWMAAK